MILKGDALVLDTFDAVDSEYSTANNPNPTQDVREYYKMLQEALAASEKALLQFADPYGKVGDFQRYVGLTITEEHARAISEALKAIEKVKTQ